MNYRIMFVLNALVALVFGAGFLVVPALALKQFGVETRVPELLIARFFGSALLTIGLLLWFAKDVTDDSPQKGMGIALLIGAVCGLIVTVLGVTSVGVIRSNGWLPIALYFFFGLGYAFLVFIKPRMM